MWAQQGVKIKLGGGGGVCEGFFESAKRKTRKNKTQKKTKK